jgi:hypothetical protein
MLRKEYEMSEKAFIDIWNKYKSPSNLYGNIDSFKFLKDLHDKTDGLFIVDHFSFINYDNLDAIEYKEPYIQFIWKDFEKNPVPRGFEAMTAEIYGADFIYSLCSIQSIKLLNIHGHLCILIMPNIAKIKEVKRFLGINNLENDKIRIEENLEEFYTSIRYVQGNKIYECILHNLPFYSFLIQPKERDMDVGLSKLILMTSTLEHVEERLEKVKNKLEILDKHDYDEIRASGNTTRTIFESLVKYYSLYFKYSLPAEHYGNNVLGDLKKHLKEDELMSTYLSQEIINLANNFSHDTGMLYSKEDALKLNNHVKETLKAINERMQKDDEQDDEADDDFSRNHFE